MNGYSSAIESSQLMEFHFFFWGAPFVLSLNTFHESTFMILKENKPEQMFIHMRKPHCMLSCWYFYYMFNWFTVHWIKYFKLLVYSRMYMDCLLPKLQFSYIGKSQIRCLYNYIILLWANISCQLKDIGTAEQNLSSTAHSGGRKAVH